MDFYRNNANAVQDLVRPDAVHRDVYVSPEIFELEMEQLWRNTWIYVGHDSQVPSPGERPSAHESMRAQGSASGQRQNRQVRSGAPALPVPRVDVQA